MQYAKWYRHHHLMVGAGVLVVALALVYWFFNWGTVSTDDAYVNADVVQVAPQISGRIIQIYIKNNDEVKKGQPLFDVDAAPFEVAVDKAKAQLALALQTEAQLEAAVNAAQAQLAIREAELQNANATAKRKLSLVSEHQLSAQEGDDAMSATKTAMAAVDLARANLQQAKMTLGAMGEKNEQIQVAKANLASAQLNLGYTHVVAAADGYVANMNLQTGAVLIANIPCFALINNDHYWADANFKETEIKQIRSGQKAEVKVDMYPGKTFQAVVDSISGGSGNAFSLLPAQNATGNWVKVTQRVPVKVRIVTLDEHYPLRIGTSATVTVFTE